MFGKIEPTINYYPPCLPLQIIHLKKEDYENEIASTKQSNTKQRNKLFSALMWTWKLKHNINTRKKRNTKNIVEV